MVSVTPSTDAARRQAQVGLYAVVYGPDKDGGLDLHAAWCVIKAYHAETDLFTVRTVSGVWRQFQPACLMVATTPFQPYQVVS